MKSILLAGLATLSLVFPVVAQEQGAAKEQRDDRMEWFRDARFGMFIHWGLYAVPAGEWKGRNKYHEWIQQQAKIPCSEYDALTNKFNPSP